MLKRVSRLMSIAALTVSFWACGCGTSVPGLSAGGGSTTLIASFTADNSSPTALEVAMTPGGGSGDQVTVTVNVTDTSGVYGGGFEVLYDPALATYLGFSAGSLLEQNGEVVSYTIVESSPGRVVASASRTGLAAGADANGSVSLVRLNFRASRTGVSSIGFDSPFLVNSQLQDLGGLNWYGGTLVGN